MNSAEILDELQELSATKSSDSRRQLLHRITDLFEITSDQQDENHTNAFDQIMDQLAFELEESVRAEFSERLADMANAPRRVTHKFAIDSINVARPVLQRSKILSDEFLVKVAKTQSQDHLLAISDRASIAAKVTDVLVNRGNTDVLKKVTSNEGANFSRQSFERLTTEAGTNDDLNTLLNDRKDTPKDLRKMLQKRVSEKIKSEAKDAGIDLSDQEIDETVKEKSTNIKMKDAEQEAAYQEIEYLHNRKQLDERVIIHYIKLNKVNETIYALGLMTGLDKKTVEHGLLTAELPALAVMSKASGFQRSTFASLLQLRENLSDISSSEVIDAIRRYEGLDQTTAERVMRFLKVRGIEEATSKEIRDEVAKGNDHNSEQETASKPTENKELEIDL